MPLTKCPECNKDVSTQAVTCPHCGYPLIVVIPPVSDALLQTPNPKQENKFETIAAAWHNVKNGRGKFKTDDAKGRKNKNVGCGCASIIIIFIILVSMCSSPAAKDSPELKAEVRSAIDLAGVGSAIYDIDANADGEVYVTLNLKRDNLGGEVHIDDTVRGLTWIVFKVPEVKRVYVTDANNKYLGGDTRQ